MQTNNIPWEFYVESTPNPAAMKFVASKLIIENGGTAQYNNIIETKHAPLMQKLFEFPFTKNIFVSSNYITITKHDFINWEDVFIEVKDFLTDYTRKGNSMVLELPKKEVAIDNEFKETKTVFTEHVAPKDEVEAKIIETLETYIRPAVEQDGGLITFKSFNEGIVTVQMRGACSGCPSSTMTLKAGIEALLKRLLPNDVKEVVSEAM